MNAKHFSTIYRDLYSPLCYFAEKILKDRFKAEEVVADVFEKLWNMKTAEDIENIKAFLYTATRNQCLDQLEQRQIRQKHHKVLLQLSPLAEDEILKEIYFTEALREISQAVHTLPEQCRKVITMTYENGLSTKEIADQLGVTVSTVKTQRARGISIIRKLLSSRALSIAISLLLN
ncbi:RNA polymerase sigma-70 factor [Chitinophaga ginsengisoli]|uniref:RNA polymerase sigma-70 factor (ECF subfamily) n=1 Tax=Chitinophaga ginsengisoli TaxID=363837 RepID=A0A2P8G5A1_9BACT|nr:RNA polymerase sigma-70 factor [Chitinophaga ginsengisoli]PSL29144.1 RNA polymerase sigma-70 factor (ECF subfamily) [Chitinophaga ginsengisoli]